YRVGEKADADRLAAFGLLLELDHAPQLAEGGGALEQPAQPGVLGHVALHKDGAYLRIEPTCEQPRGCVQGALAQDSGVLLEGQGMKVDNAEDRVSVLLVYYPLSKGAEIVADVR